MLTLKIGDAHHAPDGRVLYPVYHQTEFTRFGPEYIDEGLRKEIASKIDQLYGLAKVQSKTRNANAQDTDS